MSFSSGPKDAASPVDAKTLKPLRVALLRQQLEARGLATHGTKVPH